MESNSKLALWIPASALIGAAVGAVIGILFAPREGKETRRIIREKSTEYKNKAQDMTHRLRERIPVARRTKIDGPVAGA